MLTGLLIIFVALFATLSYRKTDWAVFAVIALLPTYLIRFSAFGIPATLLELMVVVLFVVWLVKYIQEPKKRNLCKTIHILKWPILLFVVTSTISVFVSPDIRTALGIWKAYIIEPVLFLMVMVDTVRTKKQFISVLWALGASIVVPGLFAVYQQITGNLIPNSFWQAESTRRVTSFYGYPNAIGLYFAPIVVGAIGMVAHKLVSLYQNTLTAKEKSVQKWKLPLFILLLGIGVAGIIFARSKGAILGVGAGLLVYALFWKSYRTVFAGGIVAGSIIILLLQPSLLSLQGESNVAGGGSFEIRVSQWKETTQLLLERPIVGAGLSGYQTRIEKYHSEDYIETFMYPHNIILNFWVETGLFGLVAILWIIFSTIQLLIRLVERVQLSERHLVMSVFGGFVAILAHGLVDVPFFKNDLAILFWVFVGLALIGTKYAKELNSK